MPNGEIDEGEIQRLFDAIEAGDVKAVRHMIRADARLLSARLDDEQALHIACYQKNLSIVRFLVQRGADVNARGDWGETPLHCTAYQGGIQSLPIARLLIEAGADPNVLDGRTRRTPLDYAVLEQLPELKPLIDYLLKHGARMTAFAAAFVLDGEQFKQFLAKNRKQISTESLRELEQIFTPTDMALPDMLRGAEERAARTGEGGQPLEWLRRIVEHFDANPPPEPPLAIRAAEARREAHRGAVLEAVREELAGRERQ